MNLHGCYKRTDPFALAYTYDCSNCGFFAVLLSYAAYAFPGVNFILYLLIYIHVLKMRFQLQKSRQWFVEAGSSRNAEIKLVSQFLAICVIQFCASNFFYILPATISGSRAPFYIAMTVTILNTVVNPAVVLIFQSKIRYACRLMLSSAS
ncbi:hypothetical protein OSTOST_10035 [Ostertagia ostertagi]